MSDVGTGEDKAAALTRRPDPDAEVKPASLQDLTQQSWAYLARRSLREFWQDECTDLAAGLTYYSVLAVFPALLAVISLLGVLGQSTESSLATILEIAGRVAPAAAVQTLRVVLVQLSTTPAATLGLVLGIAGALWFVSSYLGALGRALNRIYGLEEGRSLWKVRLQMILLALLLGVLGSCALLLLVVSGPVARAVGEVFQLTSTVVLLWNVLKWPVLAGIVVAVFALLYHLTPNVQQPRFRWLSPGALVAILTWLAGSALFGWYAARLSLSATYGSLAGGFVFLVWLWVSNVAVLLGGELDAEVERARELQAGIPAEHEVQLPPRDVRVTAKVSRQRKSDVAAARQIRDRHAVEGDGSARAADSPESAHSD